MAINKLSKDYYLQNDVLDISRDLLGKVLVTNFNGLHTSGIIVETEVYRAPDDKASHAYNNRRTKRTETMFAAGGISYVYLCYGLHHLFNVVTGAEGIPHAVLIRAIEPLEGIDHMLQRRKMINLNSKLSAGPAILTQALGITTLNNATDLTGSQIWIEDRGLPVPKVIATSRIGVAYAQEHAQLPWRFLIKDHKWVSKRWVG